MFDLDSTRFKRSLSETIAWCAAQPLTVHPTELAAARHRRALLEQSGQLMRQAHERVNQSWFLRRASKTSEWRQAMRIINEVRSSLAPLETRLRSAALKPNFALDDSSPRVPWAEVVGKVVARRSGLMSDTPQENSVRHDRGGRLLAYVPAENLADGAAQYASDGFFDVNNVPPWDVWIDFSDRTLVSWVPCCLAEPVQAGIDVNPEGCIRWAD